MNTSPTGFFDSLSRRDFLVRTGLATVGVSSVGQGAFVCQAAEALAVQVVIFSKAYQPLKLSFTEAAEFTAEAGLDGVDSPVRPEGEVLPERVAEDLPAYVGALQKRGLRMPFLTTAITSVSSPQAESILRTAKKLGVDFYRLGFMDRPGDIPWDKQLREIKARFKDLAALNKEIGIGAVMQNHSPSGRTYVGGDVDELAAIVGEFDPAQIGVAFDIAHALNVHSQDWRPRFEKIKSHLKVVYVKDTNRAKRFVPLGQGEVGRTDYFKALKQIGYRAPISLHIEYDSAVAVQPETRPALLKAVKDSLRTLKQWLSEA
jgi:sugar phosphate isomerase/epimerase